MPSECAIKQEKKLNPNSQFKDVAMRRIIWIWGVQIFPFFGYICQLSFYHHLLYTINKYGIFKLNLVEEEKNNCKVWSTLIEERKKNLPDFSKVLL